MKIHFIGIGGIGVSALARYYLTKGHQVSGSDLTTSEITQDLEKLGAKITIGPHHPDNLTQTPQSSTPGVARRVVYSVAIEENNPELEKAKQLGIKVQTYPQALGELTKEYQTIAIAGAHGKGTTTALISLILVKAGLDPSVIIGTNLKEFNNANCRVGEGQYLVIEADEYDRAFLNYWPQIIVLTNIDKEHLDCYQDLDEIIKTFKEFIAHLPENGTLVINGDDRNSSKFKVQSSLIAKQLQGAKATGSKLQLKTQSYSLSQPEAERIRGILKIPGEHNVSNALAALTLARILKIPDEISFKALSQYQGAWRRFEIVKNKPYVVISDYAHHPAEIKATLASAREKFPKQKIWAVFQPHQYQRTHYLFDDFVGAFKKANEIVLTEIYSVAGREKKEIIEKVNGQKLAKAIKKSGQKVNFVADFEKIPDFLKEKLAEDDVVLVMGAGTIYKIVKKFV